MFRLFLPPLLLLLLTSESKSGDIESVIRFGDSLYFNRNYLPALREYQRAYFFANKDLKSSLGKKIADCFFSLENYNSAENYYDSALFYSSEDSLRISLELNSVLCIMMLNNFGNALMKLRDIQMIPFPYLQKKQILYQGICHFGNGEYDKSYNYFQAYLSPEDTIKKSRLKDLFENHKSLKRPYSSLAVALSIVLPGAGQVYSGDIKDGLNSFLLLSGIVYLGSTFSFPSNLLIIAPLFQRYYAGGIINAKNKADSKRKEKQYEYYTGLMNILL